MQQMIMMMTMGQQHLQPTQIANIVGNMTMPPSSNDTSNDVELVDPNDKKEDNEE